MKKIILNDDSTEPPKDGWQKNLDGTYSFIICLRTRRNRYKTITFKRISGAEYFKRILRNTESR